MRAESDFRPVAYLLLVAGILLAGLSAVIPHYGAGHRLALGVLVVGFLPYLVYGALTEVLRGWSLVLPGALIVPLHAWLTVSQRYLAYDEYKSGAIYTVPILLTVIALPLAILAGHFLNGRRSPSEVAAVRPSSEEMHPEKGA